MSPSVPAVPQTACCSSRGTAILLEQSAGPEGVHRSMQGAARALVSRIPFLKPGDGAQRSGLRVEDSSQTAKRNRATNPWT